tara:strand:+ start:330 stop:803 length:474 start_codon:yes stop_codon:yes gene_type:complete
MAAKPITQLAKDLREFIEEGRAQAGPEIVYSLQNLGPWWTGNFSKSWKLGSSAIKPVKARTIENPSVIPRRTARLPKKPSVLRIPVNSPLYIGNESTYAGFGINASQQTIRGRTYSEHAQVHKITAVSVDWYDVYTQTNLIFKDLSKGFDVAFKSKV